MYTSLGMFEMVTAPNLEHNTLEERARNEIANLIE